MAPAVGLAADRRKDRTTAKTRIKKISRKRSALQCVRKTAPIQKPREEKIMKLGINSFKMLAYWSDPSENYCYICGEADHFERFCPFNYIYGKYDPWCCRADCPSGQHKITSASYWKFLRCVVRVNNLPPSFKACELATLFKPFGKLLMWDAPSSGNVCQGYAAVVFKNREDGERAIDQLNGYDSDGHKLRIDWAYPCF